MIKYAFLDMHNQCLFTDQCERIELTYPEFRLLIALANNIYNSTKSLMDFFYTKNVHYIMMTKTRLLKKVNLKITTTYILGYKLETPIYICNEFNMKILNSTYHCYCCNKEIKIQNRFLANIDNRWIDLCEECNDKILDFVEEMNGD